MTRKSKAATAVSACLFLLCALVPAAAESRSGLSFGVGLGTKAAIDKESYFDSGFDLYPECFVSYDRDSLLAEASAGLLYTKATVKTMVGSFVLSQADYTQEFIPVELSLKYLPLKAGRPDSLLQPFAGLGAGCLIAAGDNDKSFFVLSPDLGLSLGRRNVFELDCAYNLVLGEKDLVQGDNLDYLKVGLRYKYRFPLD